MNELWATVSQQASDFAFNMMILGIALVIGWLVAIGVFKAVKMTLKEIPDAPPGLINEKFRFALHLFIIIIAFNIAFPFTTLSPQTEFYIHKILYIGLILSIAFFLIKVTGFIKEILYRRFDISMADNLSGRKARTQIDFLQKLAAVIILFVALAIVFMSFNRVRELGTSLLASAGIAGIIVGLAAQKSLSNLLAGFQIAFTQPIRLDDVVIVENEWGRIEEITLTYVVVRIWDQRRLIVPISHFIDKPFQNWTRVSSDILGTVFLYTDYTVPIDELRKELVRILKNEGNTLWDGEIGIIQVTNTSDKGVELRILVSTKNASLGWDLRCLVREQMISFIQKNYPEALPKIRWEEISEVEKSSRS